jgi:hypothetical protein
VKGKINGLYRGNTDKNAKTANTTSDYLPAEKNHRCHLRIQKIKIHKNTL